MNEPIPISDDLLEECCNELIISIHEQFLEKKFNCVDEQILSEPNSYIKNRIKLATLLYTMKDLYEYLKPDHKIKLLKYLFNILSE